MQILYVEDNPLDADLTRHALHRSVPHFQMDAVTTLSQAIARLEESGPGRYDLVLTDLKLPDGDGLALLTHIRERGLPLAVVLITGQGGEEVAATALKAGADDYVVKHEAYLERLPLTLENALYRYRAEVARYARTLRVLYAEHYSTDIDLTRRHLARHAPHIHLDVVNTGPEVLRRFAERGSSAYDLILLDYRLPDLDALNLLKELQLAHGLDVPVVLITGHGSEQVAVQALKLGAADYVVKNVGYLHQLPSVLENAFHRAQMVREQNALRESELRYRTLFEGVPIGLYRTTPEGQVVDVNPAFVQMMGYPDRETLLAINTDSVYIDIEERQRWKTQMKREGTVRGFETQWRRYDGSIIWVQDTAVAIPDADGQVLYYEGAVEDITERKGTEQALRESLQTSADIVQAIPSGLFTYQYEPPDRMILLDGNPEAERLTGISVEEWRGKEFNQIWPQAQATGITQAYLDVIRTGKTFEIEDLYYADEQFEGAFRIRAFSMSGDRLGVAFENVTARKQAQEAREQLLIQIQAHAQRVQQIVDTVPEGVLLLDAAGRIVLVNPVAEKSLGVLVSARVGDTLTHLGDRPLTELLTSPPKGLWHDLTTGKQSFQVIARPIETGPTLGGWVLLVRDVTQQREFERRVRQQERLAAVGQLAAGIAHDFNNVMSTIALYAQMSARSKELPEHIRERMGTINQQAQHATQLIRRILDFSRRTVLERQPLDLLPFLKEQVKLLQRTLPESIKIQLVYGSNEYGTAFMVNADPTSIQQTVMNLALNARDAMPEGGDLCIRVEPLEISQGDLPPLPEMEAGTWLQVTVSDTGMGIPPDVLPHIFDPFFTTKGPGEGSGLGLAQVHGIVGSHEGHIDVASQVGQGTVFDIYLPALTVYPPKASTLTVLALLKGQGETILLVEDNDAARRALLGSLELLNYRVLETSNGLEALEMLEQHGENIALVLSDVVMPEMGGIALLHNLRQRGSTVPVVMLTGHPMEKELKNLSTQGLSAWLPKPPGLERLAKVVAQALKEDRMES